jgi:hypothetical protein
LTIRTALASSAIGLTVCALAFASIRSADAIGDRLGRALGGLFMQVSALRTIASHEDETALELWSDDELEPALGAANDARGTKKGKPRKAAPAPRKLQGTVHVGARTVLDLASSRARPSAVTVAGAGSRPSGLRLKGVSALGIGLRDGDVLTHVAGQHVTAKSDVVAIVLTLRSRQVRDIEAVFWRDGKPWRLVVEQPYPEFRR